MYDCPQNVVLVWLRERILYAKHYATIAERPSERRMYDTMRKIIFSAHMANDVYQAAKNCATCKRNCKRTKRKRHLKLFPALEAFQYIALYILSLLARTMDENVFITVMTG